MSILKKNRFNIIILLAVSILFTWSFYIVNTQVNERRNLEKLDVHIEHYGYISEIIHALQFERKSSVLYGLNYYGITKESLKSLYKNTDEKIDKCMVYMSKHKLVASNQLKLIDLKNIRQNIESGGHFDICDNYTSIIRSFIDELAAIYMLPLPGEIKSEVMKYLLLATMHESMTQIDQAVTVAALNKKFLNRKHYRFFHNALSKANYRKHDYLWFADAGQKKVSDKKNASTSYKIIHEIQTGLLKSTPLDAVDIDMEVWDYHYSILNEMQTDLEVGMIKNIVNLTNKHISMVNSRMYLYIGLNSLVFLIILASFLSIRKLYSGLFKQKSELNTFAKAVENSDNNIIITDLDHKIVYVNEAFEKISGYTRKEIIGQKPSILQSGAHDQTYYDEINDVISSGEKWLGEFINKKKDGTLFYEKASITPLINDDGKIEGYISLKLDMTSERLSQKLIELKNDEIEYRLYHDTLTDLSNRNQFLVDLKTSVCPVVILTNINDFKQVNIFYGIQVGDEVLIQLASIFEAIAQEYHLKVYRMHSDEFALLCDREVSDSEIYDILFFIKTRVSEFKFKPKELQLLLYVSIGVSICNKNSLSPSKLQLEDADIALKFAKSSNNYYAFYEDAKSLVNTFKNNILWTKKLSEAINTEQIIPHFQPIVDRENRVVFYEALARLIDSDGNIVYPNTFLDIAKHSKLYPQITRIMIEKVFKLFEHRDDSVSINISYEDISDERTVSHIVELMDRYKIAKRLTFEILESESIKNYDDMRVFIATVKSRGCKVSIDDFGSGYSNFERILKLDIDYVKIDGSIIKNINSDENSRVVAETIVHFAKKSGFKLVAEFVCDEAVNDAVMELDIDYRQGFYLGKPQEL